MQQVFPVEALDRWFQHRMLDVHTAMPCKVLSYDAAKQTVDVRPQVKHYLLNEDKTRTVEEPPDLFDVPVAFPRAGGFHITLPIAADDFVLVIFGEEPTQAWRSKARESQPGFLDRHGWNGPFALPCGFPDKSKLPNAPATDSIVIAADDESGAVVVKSGEVRLGDATASEFVALSNLVADELARIKGDLDALKTAYDAHQHAGPLGGTGSAPALTSPPASAPVGTPNPAPTPSSPGPVAATKTKAT